MAVKEPWSGVISSEADGNVVRRSTNVNNIPDYRVNVVRLSLSSTSNDKEVVLQWNHDEMSRKLLEGQIYIPRASEKDEVLLRLSYLLRE